jgi:predicted transcriptional regulator of viral defense system
MKQRDQILKLIKSYGILRYRDIVAHHINPVTLTRLVKSGEIIRIGRGLYTLPDMDIQSGYQSFAEASKKVPQGVICLLSALAYHEITTQAPFQVWMAIEEKAWTPKIEHVQIRFVRFSDTLLKEGVETVTVQTVPVKITNPARTVADCFKYRNKIGLDVAVEALKEGWKDGRFTMDELWKYAELCRVARVIRPYVEAIVNML